MLLGISYLRVAGGLLSLVAVACGGCASGFADSEASLGSLPPDQAMTSLALHTQQSQPVMSPARSFDNYSVDDSDYRRERDQPSRRRSGGSAGNC